MKDTILQRIREPSTWAGIAALGAVFGLPADTISLVGQVVMGCAGLAAVVLSEGGAK
ncbi:hypothetical protein [uncultured Pseudacidovorax sp.]|uniref:hypothetical protein n=1 Tax=uncultured Pseudacidovorax sp. TaxID=679313 RepID=UPI0025D6D61D|nr:hypothetical protein [uncultured Pseudacidovorax sp.]